MARSRQRRKVLVDTNNHDRWIVSYADFITLLFAFFVVMYSISSVNESKYKSLTESLGTAFSNTTKTQEHPAKISGYPMPAPEKLQLPPVEIPENATTSSTSALLGLDTQRLAADLTEKLNENPVIFSEESIKPALTRYFDLSFSQNTPNLEAAPDKADTKTTSADAQSTEANKTPDFDSLKKAFGDIGLTHPTIPDELPAETVPDEGRKLSEGILNERKRLNDVSDQLENALGQYIKDNLVAVKRNDFWIELEMNSELLFLSGEADLSVKALPVLKEIAQVINTLPNAIHVEGHTDNVPISNLKFPSNWELSSARATSVVQEFIKAGINPSRLAAIGYGEFHPIDDNSAESGRFNNRRVTLVLMSQAFARYGANDAERAKLLNLGTEAGQTPPSDAQQQQN